MTAEQMREAARRVVDSMPPLSPEQITKISRLLQGGERR